jgi:hypothetical protein
MTDSTPIWPYGFKNKNLRIVKLLKYSNSGSVYLLIPFCLLFPWYLQCFHSNPSVIPYLCSLIPLVLGMVWGESRIIYRVKSAVHPKLAAELK